MLHLHEPGLHMLPAKRQCRRFTRAQLIGKFRAAAYVIIFLQHMQRKARLQCRVWIAEWQALAVERSTLVSRVASHPLGSWNAIRDLRDHARILESITDDLQDSRPVCVGIQPAAAVILGSLRWRYDTVR